MTVLRVDGAGVSFGGVHALVDVDLEVEEGQLAGLIGPNGAGKTTFIDAISGFVPCRGRVELDGRDLSGLPPHVRARRGLARTWQSIELFDDLTVRENLAVAARSPAAVDAAVERLGLEPLTGLLATDLTQGQRKLVGVGRALVAGPRLLCLDEPAAGLDARESEALGGLLRSVVDAGTAMLLVDHDMGLVLSVCDVVYVLEFGRLIAQGPPDSVRRDQRVVQAYLGSAAAEVAS